jgi:hypothetical protein
MVDEFDNRLRLPPPKIDFEDDVGTTGQDHDTFPAPKTQPRYDWMRMYLIALLSHQSSEDDPSQKRVGTTWMQRIADSIKLKFWDGDAFQHIANAIVLEETGSGESSADVLTLAEWFIIAQAKLDQIQSKPTWSGSSISDGVTEITVPESVQSVIEDVVDLLRPLVYINGILVDPRNSEFAAGCVTTVSLLNGVEIDEGDRFTVIVEKFDPFVPDEVVVE